MTSVNRWLGDAVGKTYAQKYFPAAYKADIDGMVKNIKAALEKRIDALTWMAAGDQGGSEEEGRDDGGRRRLP